MADSDRRIRIETVLDHLAVARLENVQREDGTWEGNAARDWEYADFWQERRAPIDL